MQVVSQVVSYKVFVMYHFPLNIKNEINYTETIQAKFWVVLVSVYFNQRRLLPLNLLRREIVERDMDGYFAVHHYTLVLQAHKWGLIPSIAKEN